jgi:two-component system NarL family sensor kinase
MSDPAPARSYEQRDLIFVAIPRALAVPLFLGFLGIAGEEFTEWVWIVVALATVYVLALLWLATSRHWAAIDARWFIASDLVTMAAAMIAGGGPESQVQAIFFVWTLAMAMLFPPRLIPICALGAMLSYAAGSIPFVLDEDDALRQLGLVELTLAWIGLVTYFLSDSFHRRQDRIARLSEARRLLLADALSAEDRARRRLSQNLHDEALQTLLAAGQDLDAGIDGGDRSQLSRAREGLRSAVAELRKTIRGLHPAALEHGGLSGGLDAVTERAAAQGGFEIDLRVDPAAAGWHDALIVSLVRELTTNAAKHAEASQVLVRVDRQDGSIAVEVTDDGRGMPEGGADAALAEGHIGLASSRERVDALGGTMELDSAPGEGTRLAISLPLPAEPNAQRGDPQVAGRPSDA